MIDFFAWCNEKGLDIPVEVQDTSDAVKEDRAHTGAKEPLYPPQYFAGQYPPSYKTPIAADSAYYQSINKQQKPSVVSK
jgi:hypothetical protein